MADVSTNRPANALRQALVPLALAPFICSFTGSDLNVMINDISGDLNTTVQGVQVTTTLFLLIMAHNVRRAFRKIVEVAGLPLAATLAP